MSALLPYFKTYDIRGTVPDQINPEVAYRIGRAVRAWVGAEEIVRGRDARLSSPALAGSLIRGLLGARVKVRDQSLATTPTLNFAVARRRLYGLMITASHNPKQDNGIKVIDGNVEQVYYGRGLERLEQLVVGADSGATAAGGSVVIDDILPEYHDHLLSRFGNLDLSPPGRW